MTILICIIIILAVFALIGLSSYKLIMQILKKTWIMDNIIANIALAPLIGCSVVMGIFQSLLVFFSINNLIPLLLFIIILSIVNLKNELLILSNNIKKLIKWIFIIVSIPIANANFLLKSNELTSIQYINNDIIYYLSTMDWISSHSLLDKIIYSESKPYFLCAEYILKTTRFGSEVLGSLFMRLLCIKAHEIFTLMGIVYVIIAALVIFFILTNVFNINNLSALIGMLIVGWGAGWSNLLVLQYIPQILGIAALLGFLGCLIKYTITKDKEYSILTSLFIAAVAASYAEFAVYMVGLYAGIYGINLIKAKKGLRKMEFASGIILGLRAIIFNPIGIIVALKFNYRIFLQIINSTNSIDAYNGNMMSPTSVLLRLLYGIDKFSDRTLYIIIIGIITCFIVGGFLYKIIKSVKKKNQLDIVVIWICVFIIVYEAYFIKSNLAYGEFKHISSMAPIIQLIIYAYVSNFIDFIQKYKGAVFYIATIITVIFLFNIKYIKIFYPHENLFYYDKSLSRIEGVVNEECGDNIIGICSNSYAIQHSLIYALKDKNVQLMGERVNSYYAMLGIPLNNDANIEYLITGKEVLPQTIQLRSYNTVWRNSIFLLLKEKKEKIQTNMGNGFYGIENDSYGNFWWTSQKESYIYLKNTDKDDIEINFQFYAGDSPVRQKTLSVYCNNELMFKGKTSELIKINNVIIEKGKVVEIKIVTEEALDTITTGDIREFGFLFRNFSVDLVE